MGPMVGKIATHEPRDGSDDRNDARPPGQPFLHDHCIDGTPVLPGVMGIEAFAEAPCVSFPDGMSKRSKT